MELGPGSRVGNLVIERLLGRGGFGKVYHARDTLIDRVVAAKVLPPLPPSERQAFLNEARLIGQLRSPHVVTLYQVHQLEDGGWLLEMELVEGGSVADHLAGRARLPLPRVLRIARQVLGALGEAHRLGIVHRDIKPANVLLTHGGDAKLADFGLATRALQATVSSADPNAFVGTPHYMAPEVMMGAPPAPAADIWSVGVLLFQLANGSLPFSGGTLHHMFVAVHNAAPAPLGPHVPPELAHAISCCLAKSPADRPANAEEALALLDRVASDDSMRVARRLRLPAKLPRLHGRVDETASARTLLEQVQRRGRGASLALAGDAGIGKSALIDLVGAVARESGFRWIEIGLVGGQGLVRGIVDAARRLREREPDLTAFKADSYSDNVWRTVEALLDESLEEGSEAAWGVESLITELARNGPVCLVVDDAHEADEHEAQLLQVLARRLANAPVLFVFGFRTGGEPSPLELLLADDLRVTQRIDLGPLDGDAVYRVLQDAADGAEIDGAVAKRIARMSEGNPLIATELLRFFEAEGAVARDDSHVFEGATWGARRVPERFREMAIQRLGGLDDEDRAMLDVAAVDGVWFDGRAVAAVAERPLLEALRAMQALCRRPGLLSAGDAGFRFAHALLREAVYDALSPDYRAAVHGALAQHLVEREEQFDPERIGGHWLGAGELERAKPYLRRAAVGAAKRQDIRRAIDLSQRAGLMPGEIDPATAREHAEVLLELVHCYADAGKRDEESALYDVLLEAAADDEQLRLRTIVSRSYSRYYVDGPAAVDAESIRRATDVLPPSRVLGRAFYMRGVVAKNEGHLDDAVANLERAEQVWSALDLDGHRSSALNELASVARRRGRNETAKELYDEAATLSERVGRLTNAAISRVNRTLAARECGDVTGMEETLARSIRTLRVEGVRHVAGHVGNLLAGARISAGDFDGAQSAIEAAREDLLGSGYVDALTDVLMTNAVILGARGKLADAWARAAEAREHVARAESARERLHLAAIEMDLLCWGGDTDAAADVARRALDEASALDARARADLAVALARATLYGLPVEFAQEARAAVEVERDAFGAWVEAMVDGPLALQDSSLDIRGPADRLLEPGVTHEVTESRILGQWFAAEAENRARHPNWAEKEARAARHAAHDFGHVFLEAALLRYLQELTGDDSHRTERRRLIEPAASLLEDEDAVRLRAAWDV